MLLYFICGITICLFIGFIIYERDSFCNVPPHQYTCQLTNQSHEKYTNVCNGDPLCLYDEPLKKSQNPMFA